MPMSCSVVAIAALLLVTGPEARSPVSVVDESPGQFRLSQCLVSLIDEAQVPAQEAGVLVDILVREGQQVAAGERLAQIDDAQTVSALEVATLKHEVAQEKAQSDVDVRYARAASEVARVEYEQAWRANQKSAGAISDTEVRRLYLTDRRAVLAIEQASLDLRVAAMESKVFQAERHAAALAVQRRQISAPLDGVVVQVNRRKGEWVQPGDPVVHVVRMDRLRVEGLLTTGDVRDHDGRLVARGCSPARIAGRPVTVAVRLDAGRTETFEGRVVFVSPLVQAGGEYRFWAEVVNRKQADHWLLLPGMMAEMTIRLGPSRVAASGEGNPEYEARNPKRARRSE